MATNFLAPTPAELEREWGQTLSEEWSTDIVAGDFAPIIRRYGVGEAAQREVVLARFGLQQATAKGVRAPASTVNARTETAATRSAFKGAWAGRQWCIVPAQCFYVPYYADDSKKSERWRIRRTDRSPLSIAGLWDRWVGDDGETMLSFSILTLNCDLHPAALALPSPDQRQGRAAGEAHAGAARRRGLRRLARHHAGAGADVLRHLRQGRPRGRAGAEQSAGGDDDDAARHRNL